MAPDPGLFGPDTVTWRVHADPVMWLGGVRALLLQALHPLAMIGVAQHSGYREDPWGRLVRTARYIGATTFGTTEEALAAGEHVRHVHQFVKGVDPETGAAYRADDPDLLLWVHCCEVDSFLATYRRAGGPLAPGDGDVYVAEQVRMAPLVELDPALVPDSEAALRDYFRRVRPQLRASREARRAAAFAVAPPMPAWVQLATPARPAWAAAAAVAFGLLPPWARRLYGLPGLPTTDLTAGLAARALRRALLAVPPSLRQGPHHRDALARLAAEPPESATLAAVPGERG